MFGINFTLALLGNSGRRQRPARHRPALECLESLQLLSGIAAGPDGNLWLAGGGMIRRLSLDGTATDFALPTLTSRALAITPGPDGNLWFTEADQGFLHFFDGKIGRITPDGTITEFDIPTPHAMYPGSPGGITAGPDGNLWFTEPLGGQIGRITPDGTVTEFPLPAGSADPDGITAGPDGNLWFTEAFQIAGGNKIGRITPDGTVTEFPLPTPNSLGFTEEITAGPDGNLWFPEGQRNQIGRITPDGTLTEFALPTPSFDPMHATPGITAGPDGNVWFTELNPGQVAQITPDGSITEFPLPDRTFPGEITAGPDGNLWFTKSTGSGIGEFTLDGGSPAMERAAVEAVFAGARSDRVEPAVVNRQPARVTVDAASVASGQEAVTATTALPIRVESASPFHRHPGSQAVTQHVAGLSDALAQAW